MIGNSNDEFNFPHICGSFTKNKERIQKIKETGDSRHIYQKELDKASFQQDMDYGVLKICLKEKLLIKYYVINI